MCQHRKKPHAPEKAISSPRDRDDAEAEPEAPGACLRRPPLATAAVYCGRRGWEGGVRVSTAGGSGQQLPGAPPQAVSGEEIRVVSWEAAGEAVDGCGGRVCARSRPPRRVDGGTARRAPPAPTSPASRRAFHPGNLPYAPPPRCTPCRRRRWCLAWWSRPRRRQASRRSRAQPRPRERGAGRRAARTGRRWRSGRTWRETLLVCVVGDELWDVGEAFVEGCGGGGVAGMRGLWLKRKKRACEGQAGSAAPLAGGAAWALTAGNADLVVSRRRSARLGEVSSVHRDAQHKGLPRLQHTQHSHTGVEAQGGALPLGAGRSRSPPPFALLLPTNDNLPILCLFISTHYHAWLAVAMPLPLRQRHPVSIMLPTYPFRGSQRCGTSITDMVNGLY